MEKIITYESLRSFAYSNDRICSGPIRGIAVSFFGLGGAAMFSEDTKEGKFFAEHNIIYIVPYANPWAWMNRQTAAYMDEIIDVLIRHYDLPDNLPIVSTGGSMGGQSALVYMVYAARTPTACVANCPVCDLPFHFTERPDLPRTLYSAFGTYDGTMQEALESASPFHLADKMPDSAYYIFHCEADLAVNKQKHSDRFVEKMTANHTITYYAVPERGHCDLTPEMWQKYNDAIVQSIIG